jgi:hypothetical protein
LQAADRAAFLQRYHADARAGTGSSKADATAASIGAFVRERHMSMLTFVGYSGAGYEAETSGLETSKVLDDAARRAIGRDNALALFPRFGRLA